MLLVDQACAGVLMAAETVQRWFGNPPAAAASGVANDDANHAESSSSTVKPNIIPPNPATVFLISIMDKLVQQVLADKVPKRVSKLLKADLEHLHELVQEELRQRGFRAEADNITVGWVCTAGQSGVAVAEFKSQQHACCYL